LAVGRHLLQAFAHVFVELLAFHQGLLDGAAKIVEGLLAFGHFVPHVALEAALQEVVGERAEQVLHAHFAGGVGDVFGVADAFHKAVSWLVRRRSFALAWLRPKTSANGGLVKLSSLPVRWFFLLETFLALARFGLFLSGFEDSFFIAADALVRVQALEDEFGGGDLLLRTFFLRDAERAEFVDEALNVFKFSRASRAETESGQLNLAAEVEPLHDLLHVGAGEVFIVSFGDGGADEFAAYVVRAFHLAFIFEFEFAGNGGQGGVDVADARHDELFVVADGAALGVRDNVFHCGNGQALADAGALVDFLIFAGGESDALDYFLNVGGQVHGWALRRSRLPAR
jgi:hypothetical protein